MEHVDILKIITCSRQVSKTSERRLSHLTKAADELAKFEEESKKFRTWMGAAFSELTNQEDYLKRFEDLKVLGEKHRELASDISSHQADHRFMSMAVQKYMEEAKVRCISDGISFCIHIPVLVLFSTSKVKVFVKLGENLFVLNSMMVRSLNPVLVKKFSPGITSVITALVVIGR